MCDRKCDSFEEAEPEKNGIQSGATDVGMSLFPVAAPSKPMADIVRERRICLEAAVVEP